MSSCSERDHQPRVSTSSVCCPQAWCSCGCRCRPRRSASAGACRSPRSRCAAGNRCDRGPHGSPRPRAVSVAMTAPHRGNWVPLLVAALSGCAALSTARLDEQLRGTGFVPVLFAVTSVAVVHVPAGQRAEHAARPRRSSHGDRRGWGEPRGDVRRTGIDGVDRPSRMDRVRRWHRSARRHRRRPWSVGGLVFAARLTLAADGLVLATQCGNALVCSRVAGVSHNEVFAVVVVALALAATVVVLTWSAS